MTGIGQHMSLPDITGETWRNRAACAGQDPRWWEPSDTGTSVADRDRWAAAVRVCATCPVRNQCATDVTQLDAGSIRGGLLVTKTGGLRVAPPPTAQPPARRGRPPLVPCGQRAARKRHQRRKESCPVCKTGDYGRQTGLKPCGTRAAKNRHWRRGESCSACGIGQAS